IAGGWIHSVALLTCAAAPNRIASAIHDRMPVILAGAEERRAWLDPALEVEDALALCQPVRAGRLTARPANPPANRPHPHTARPPRGQPPRPRHGGAALAVRGRAREADGQPPPPPLAWPGARRGPPRCDGADHLGRDGGLEQVGPGLEDPRGGGSRRPDRRAW